MDAIEKINREWTAVALGSYLDYWGIPKVKSHLRPFTPFLDLAGKKAAIPGNRNLSNVFNYSQDAAEFIAKLLTLDQWDRTSYIVGDKLTWGEFVKLAEEVTGNVIDSASEIPCKPLILDVDSATGGEFGVTYDSLEELKSGQSTALPSHVPAYEFIPKEAIRAVSAQYGILCNMSAFNSKPVQSFY